MKNARVTFEGTRKIYDFKTDIDLQEGDKVVCDTIRGLSIATVKEVTPLPSKATKWIIQKVDLEAHNKRMEIDQQMQELKAKMDIRKKQLEEATIYKMLAQMDGEMAQLLTQYEALNDFQEGGK